MSPEALTKDPVRDDLVKIILQALEELKKTLNKGELLKISPETRLYGRGSDVDSLGLVQLLIDVEERVSGRYGFPVVLTDERALSQQDSPFRNVEGLADYLARLILERRG